MNVAVYGGSFDPPHLGHVMVPTHLLLNDPTIDEIVIMPCFQQTGKNLAPFKDRHHMCEVAFGWLPRTQVSDLEYRLGGESLTLRTMRALKTEHPNWNLRFVVGSDLLDSMPSWDGYEELCAIAPPLPIGRAGISPVRPDQPTPISPIVSSTIVREALARRDYETAGRYVPRLVLHHIGALGLYRDVAGVPTTT
jgi:nicotinate-nucleotide adenylyltransferase